MNQITLSSDALLRLAFAEAEHRELRARRASIQETGGYQPSAEFARRMELLIRAEKRNARYHRVQKALKRVAVVVVICLALSTCVFMPVQSVQQAVVTTVVEWQDKFAAFTYSTDGGAVSALPSTIRVNYLPEGYKENSAESQYDENMFFAVYTKAKEQICTVYIQVIDGEHWSAIDNERSEIFQLVLDDKNVLCSMHEEGTIMLRWVEGTLFFEVTTTESLQEAIAIARGIQY